jgi:lysyl-tRNA synthetase class 2
LRPDDRDGWLNLLLAELVEPRLGRDAPEFLYDYPASQGALARVRAERHPVAERFELYLHGIELCNGYHELTDAAELRRRNGEQLHIRQEAGSSTLPVASRLLEAMEHGLPDSAGVALGFDRVAMLAAGKTTIDEVVAFPIDRA